MEVLRGQTIHKEINGRLLFDIQGISLKTGQKVGLVGRNGVGKTTFIQQILSQSLPGYYSNKLEIAYFSQNFQQLDEEKTVFENASRDGLQDKVTILNLLAMLGLRYDKARQKAGQLSGGERVRLALAKVLLSDANLLILDESTNFLDLISLEALEDFLKDYQGSLLLISHDDVFYIGLSKNWRAFRILNCSIIRWRFYQKASAL